jgi:DNA phosphorothioation-dependent restriction protein DptG
MFKRDLDQERKWASLLADLNDIIGKKPKDLNAVLFLIGVQELGKGNKNFSKEEKQDLMHIGICKVLSLSGYYELEGHDKDGWPHWKLIKKLPHFDLLEQEKLLKIHVMEYFEKEYDWYFSETPKDQSDV